MHKAGRSTFTFGRLRQVSLRFVDSRRRENVPNPPVFLSPPIPTPIGGPPMPDAVPCNHCGTPFTPYSDRGTVQRFCSDRCRYAARVDTRFTPTGTTLTATCVECGQDFTYELSLIHISEPTRQAEIS